MVNNCYEISVEENSIQTNKKVDIKYPVTLLLKNLITRTISSTDLIKKIFEK